MTPPSTCSVCGAELVEVERWTFQPEDFTEHVQQQFGRQASAAEIARFQRFIGESTWRHIACPVDPHHTGFLAERID